MIFNMIASSTPLLLCALGALFSEYAGILAMFIDGLLNFSAFLFYFFAVTTGSPIAASALTIASITVAVLILAFIIEKTKANPFVAGLGMNLFFTSLTSLISSLYFKTRGVLYSQAFQFTPRNVSIISIIVTILLTLAAIYFLKYTQKGIYLRITGSDSHVLEAKGVHASIYRISSWVISSGFTAVAGIFLCAKISSFVPNISSGRGWMALAAVFLGRKKIWKISLFTLIFCAADIFSTNIQNFIPSIPSSILLSFPYLIAIILSCLK